MLKNVIFAGMNLLFAKALRREPLTVDEALEIYTHAEEKGQSAFILHREQQAEEIRKKREGSWKQWFDWL